MNNKKIVFKVTRAYMKKNRKRTVITFLGIMLMVMMMTAVFVGKDTIMTYMTDIISLQKGSWHFQVYDVDADTMARIKSISCLDKLEVSRDYGYTLFEQSANPETPYLNVKAYSGDIFKWMNINVLEGRYPQNPNEILISKRAIDDGSTVGIGDTIDAEFFERYIHAFGEKGTGEVVFPFQNMFTVEHGATEEAPAHFPYYGDDGQFEEVYEYSGYKCTYTVVGIMEPPFFELGGAGDYVALCGGTNELAPGETVNVVGTIDLSNRGMSVERQLYGILGSHASYKVNDYILTFAGKGSDGSINKLAVFFQAFFLILIVAASAVLIYNVFNISYRERAGYLGLLSSVGATGSQKRWSVYYEIFLILIFALPLGLILGLGLVWCGMTLLMPHVSELLSLTSISATISAGKYVTFRMIVNPVNILMIVVFSAVAVWVSALIPARKIGKAGAISSIRGNDSTDGRKFRHNRLINAISGNKLKKGHCIDLLSDASVKRSRFLSRGIIRSMVIFVSLSLIVTFGVRTINDILDKKANDSSYGLGKDFEDYDYAIMTSDDEKYEYFRNYVMNAEDVTAYKESNVVAALWVKKQYLSDEYIEGVKQVVKKYKPDGVSAEEESYLYGDTMSTNMWFIILSDEEFSKLARKSGADMTLIENSEDPAVLVYDAASVTTDNYRFAFRENNPTDFFMYSLKKPLKVNVGDTFEIESMSHDPEAAEDHSGKAVLAGYVNEQQLGNLYKVDDSELWAIMTMSSALKILNTTREELPKYYFSYSAMLFKVTSDDCDTLALMQNNGTDNDPIYCRAELLFGLGSIKEVIATIIRIVAVCFVALIMAICTLNLYNSVMGRSIERRGELAVLRSVGMTDPQMQKMLHLENAKLYLRSMIWSAFISGVFVIYIHKMAENMIGRMTFSFPYVIIIAVCVLEIALLTVMTLICYRKDKISIMERIRDESISG